jgi:hypothetical protein
LLFRETGILTADSGKRNATGVVEQFGSGHELLCEVHPPGGFDFVLMETMDKFRCWLHGDIVSDLGPVSSSIINAVDQLISELDAEDGEQSRQMSGSQKLRAGGDLFDDACRWTAAGIREQHPEFTQRQVLDELRRRIEISAITEDYVP